MSPKEAASAVIEYTSEGHRLLSQSGLGPTALAKRVGTSKQLAYSWLRGTCRPTTWRDKLWSELRIPMSAWEQAPLRRTAPASQPTPPSPETRRQTAQQAATAEQSLEEIDRLIGSLDESRTELTAKEAWQAGESVAKLRIRRFQLAEQLKDRRADWLSSPEWKSDIAAFARALGPECYETLRGVASTMFGEALAPAAEPLETLSVHDLRGVLLAARDLDAVGESHLATAELLRLRLAQRASEVADLLTPELADELIPLMPTADGIRVRAALDLRFALEDVRKKPTVPGVRELLRQLGCHAAAEAL